MTKSTMRNECTSSAGRFDGQGGAPEQYSQHRPMRHVQGTPEATGCQHWVTTCPVSPQRLPEQQANKQQSTNIPKKVVMLMAAAVRRYNTACISQWRRSRALLEATGRHHRASIMSDNINRIWLQHFFYVFIVKTIGKGHGSTLRPLFLIGVRHIKWKRRA